MKTLETKEGYILQVKNDDSDYLNFVWNVNMLYLIYTKMIEEWLFLEM